MTGQKPQGLDALLGHFVNRCLRPCLAQPTKRTAMAFKPPAVRIQAVVRGMLSRSKHASFHVISAYVGKHQTTEDTSKPIATYVICVRFGVRSWEVEHRYSDWCQLDVKLGQHLKQRPALPPRRIQSDSERVRTFRQHALDNYLQTVLKLSANAPKARNVLLNFLSQSHLYWQYADSLPGWMDRARLRHGQCRKPGSPGPSPRGVEAPLVDRRSSRRTERARTTSIASDDEGNSAHPFFRDLSDLLTVRDAKGVTPEVKDLLGRSSYKHWAPKEGLKANYKYWGTVMGT